jgi:5'-nucleotidase/UDP-sugar diphosphatase
VRLAFGSILLLVLVACGARESGARLHGRVELVLLHTADTHSMLFPYRATIGSSDARRGLGQVGELGSVGGFARLATLLARERRGAERVLHLDSGDVFQGSLAFERFGGEPELLAFDALGVDAQALGNHELDRGAELVCDRYEKLARFSLLAANYGPDGAGCLAPLLQPFVVLDARGLRVGVIGVGNVSSVALLKERPNELGVLARDAAGAVQGALDVLRPEVDVVVAVTHLGLDADRELVRRTSGLDLVLGGHQHLTLDAPEWALDCGGGDVPRVADAWGRDRACSPRRVPIVHSGAYTKTFGRVRLELDDDPAHLGAAADGLDGHEIVALALELVSVSDETPEDPAVAGLLEPYRPETLGEPGAEALAVVPRTLERAGATGGDSPLGNFAASVAREAAQADVAVLGASSLRHDVLPGVLDRDALVRAVPFEDPLVSVELPGASLARAFEHAARSASGRDCRTQVHVAGMLVRFRCPCEGALCARVFATETDVPCGADAECGAFAGACSVSFGGTGLCFAPLAAGASYRVATTAYVAAGGSGLFDAIPESARRPVSDSLSQALADELRHGAPCPPGTTIPETDARVLRLASSLPCLDAGRGAVRDGRIRLEAP